MKDPKDPGTIDMFYTSDCYDDNVYLENEATEERLDKLVKEWVYNSDKKQFEEYKPKETEFALRDDDD